MTRISDTSGASSREIDAEFEPALDTARSRGRETLAHAIAGEWRAA